MFFFIIITYLFINFENSLGKKKKTFSLKKQKSGLQVYLPEGERKNSVSDWDEITKLWKNETFAAVNLPAKTFPLEKLLASLGLLQYFFNICESVFEQQHPPQ